MIEPILDGVDELNPFKQKLIDKMTNCYVGLSNDRFGTYACQKCFLAATLKRKEKMANELVAAWQSWKAIALAGTLSRNVNYKCFKIKSTVGWRKCVARRIEKEFSTAFLVKIEGRLRWG